MRATCKNRQHIVPSIYFKDVITYQMEQRTTKINKRMLQSIRYMIFWI
jgi:hypothetical protein